MRPMGTSMFSRWPLHIILSTPQDKVDFFCCINASTTAIRCNDRKIGGNLDRPTCYNTATKTEMKTVSFYCSRCKELYPTTICNIAMELQNCARTHNGRRHSSRATMFSCPSWLLAQQWIWMLRASTGLCHETGAAFKRAVQGTGGTRKPFGDWIRLSFGRNVKYLCEYGTSSKLRRYCREGQRKLTNQRTKERKCPVIDGY